jgi:DNA-binding PadR family transcriptional regulator
MAKLPPIWVVPKKGVEWQPMHSPEYQFPDSLPAPLRHDEFYALLALSRGDEYGYALTAVIFNDSRGSVVIRDDKIYPLIRKLEREVFIELSGEYPTPKSDKPRSHYAITSHGTLRLKEELQRMDHAVKIAQHTGLLNADEPPLDIQKLLLGLE